MIDAQLNEDVDGGHVVVQLSRISGVGRSGQRWSKHQSKIGRAHLTLRRMEGHSMKKVKEILHDANDGWMEGLDCVLDGDDSVLNVVVASAVDKFTVLLGGEEWSR